MVQRILVLTILFTSGVRTNAQITVMKLVGNNTKDYSIGFGAFIKAGIPVSTAADLTVDIAADIFFIRGEATRYGTIMCPVKVGYRYTLNGTGRGLYVEPQVGYNLVGVTSLPDTSGQDINLTYHGVVFAVGTGYLFSIGGLPVDVNLRYETVIAHGGSNNLISLGISKYFSFGKRETD